MRWSPSARPKKSISKRVLTLPPPSRTVSVPKLKRDCLMWALRSVLSSFCGAPIGIVLGHVEVATDGAVGEFAVRGVGKDRVGLDEAGDHEGGSGSGVRRDRRGLDGLRSGRSSRGRRGRRRSLLLCSQLLHQLLELGDARLEFLLLGGLRPRGGRHADHGSGECDRNDLAKCGVFWNYACASAGPPVVELPQCCAGPPDAGIRHWSNVGGLPHRARRV